MTKPIKNGIIVTELAMAAFIDTSQNFTQATKGTSIKNTKSPKMCDIRWLVLMKPENFLWGEKSGTGFMNSCPSCGGTYSSFTAFRVGRRHVPITKANECIAMRITELTDKRETSQEGTWVGLLNWYEVMMPCNMIIN